MSIHQEGQRQRKFLAQERKAEKRRLRLLGYASRRKEEEQQTAWARKRDWFDATPLDG